MSLVPGGQATAGVKASALSQAVLKLIEEASEYANGTRVRVLVGRPSGPGFIKGPAPNQAGELALGISHQASRTLSDSKAIQLV